MVSSWFFQLCLQYASTSQHDFRNEHRMNCSAQHVSLLTIPQTINIHMVIPGSYDSSRD